MKDIIQDRLNKIQDLNERKALKNVLMDVYENVIDYNLDMYDRLEKRIYDEIEDSFEKYYIYTTLIDSAAIDPISSFMHPMLESDINEFVYDMKELRILISENEDVVLASVFMECDFLTLKEILSQDRKYKGFIKTNKDIYEISVVLKRSYKYIEAIQNLYKIFQRNALEWQTVNCPYAFKFVDVLLKSDLAVSDDEEIEEITIDLAEFEKFKRTNVVPVWNIKKISVDDKTFPMPAEDRINYEHVINLIDIGAQNGYLAAEDNNEYVYVKRYENDLVIISRLDGQHNWNLLQIESDENKYRKNFLYPLLRNKRKLGFIGKYQSIKSLRIRTQSELARLLQQYDYTSELAFEGIEILPEYTKEIETENYNPFVDDNIRDDKYKKIMLIKFVPTFRDDFLVYDKMSFLTSEIQFLFPEYKCIGELV